MQRSLLPVMQQPHPNMRFLLHYAGLLEPRLHKSRQLVANGWRAVYRAR
jgi:hypothetical protein